MSKVVLHLPRKAAEEGDGESMNAMAKVLVSLLTGVADYTVEGDTVVFELPDEEEVSGE